ncbi:MAG: aspartate/glutamate racemase family protein [Xanthobacteraceae bacterium]|nr:aspartate/glutamate racemase family protein [Xanthobacteraceae bacterium]
MSKSLPVLGITTPRSDNWLDPDGVAIYRGRTEIVSESIGLAAMTRDRYLDAHSRIPAAVDKLVRNGADAIAIYGTSLTFSFGRKFYEDLAADLSDRTRKPVITMATSLVQALKALKCRRVAVAAAYDSEVTTALVSFLSEHEIETAGSAFMGIQDMDKPLAVTADTMIDISRRAVGDRDVDGVVMSCGGLRAIPITLALEKELSLPVVSSTAAGAWGALRMIGNTDRLADVGRLFEEA